MDQGSKYLVQCLQKETILTGHEGCVSLGGVYVVLCVEVNNAPHQDLNWIGLQLLVN